jgi:predicted TPR repeat methyltransferase
MTHRHPDPAQAAGDAVDGMLREAMALHRAGEFAAAEARYRDGLAVAPEHPDLLHWLGVLLFVTGRRDAARPLIERSIGLAPAFPGFYNNYGNVLLASGAVADAERAYRRCLELDRGQPAVWCNLGICLRRTGRVAEAVAAFEAALGGEGDHPDACKDLVDALQAQNKLDEVTSAYEASCAALPAYEPAFVQLARLYSLAGRIADAARVYRRWQEADPDHPVPRHMLAACTGEGVPARADDAMIRATFDGFAASFDAVLAKLDYRTPERLCELVAAQLPAPAGDLNVLDIGCGTGLCGPLLRPRARALTGVDLSPGMLDKARERGVYDVLAEAELVAYLREHPAAFDLIVCADTLCYFGGLEDAFAAARAALRPAGRFAFSVERADDDDTSDFRLHPHGRYAHRPAYVEAALAAAGLVRLDRRDLALRRERGEPVAGCLFCVGA